MYRYEIYKELLKSHRIELLKHSHHRQVHFHQRLHLVNLEFSPQRGENKRLDYSLTQMILVRQGRDIMLFLKFMTRNPAKLKNKVTPLEGQVVDKIGL